MHTLTRTHTLSPSHARSLYHISVVISASSSGHALPRGPGLNAVLEVEKEDVVVGAVCVHDRRYANESRHIYEWDMTHM